MEIYSNEFIDENESLDSIMEDDNIIPWKNDDFLEGSLDALILANENYNIIMEAIGKNELKCLEETGYEFVYTEASIDGFILAVKKFLVRLWRSISGVFKSFLMWFDRQTMNDKSFLNKYKEKLLSKHLDSSFSFSGYIYTIDDKEIDNAIGVLETDPSGTNSKYQNPTNYGDAASKMSKDQIYGEYADLEKTIDVLRGKVLSCFKHKTDKRDKFDGKEFHDALMEALQNGQDSKEELDNTKINIQNIINEMVNGNQTRKTIRLAFTRGKKLIDDTIKSIDNETKTILRQHVENANDRSKASNAEGRTNMEMHNDKMKHVTYHLNYVQRSRSILTVLQGSVLSALKNRSKQNKALIIKIVTYESKKESQIEEATWIHSDPLNSSFLSHIELK